MAPNKNKAPWSVELAHIKEILLLSEHIQLVLTGNRCYYLKAELHKPELIIRWFNVIRDSILSKRSDLSVMVNRLPKPEVAEEQILVLLVIPMSVALNDLIDPGFEFVQSSNFRLDEDVSFVFLANSTGYRWGCMFVLRTQEEANLSCCLSNLCLIRID